MVDLDQLINTFDARTRGDLRDVVEGFATQYRGKGPEAAEAVEYFNPLLSTSRRLIGELTEDEGSLTRFLADSSRLVDRARRPARPSSRQLVGNANAAAGAVASRRTSPLARALALLPTTLRRGNTTFVNLRATLDDLDELVAASKPATQRPRAVPARAAAAGGGGAADGPRPEHDAAPPRARQRPRRGHAQLPARRARRDAGVREQHARRW